MPVLSADVDVELDVVDRNNKPPVWDANVYGPIHIKENVTVGTVVTSVKARFVCHDMTETRHVTCRAVPCSALRPSLANCSNDLFFPPHGFCFLSHTIPIQLPVQRLPYLYLPLDASKFPRLPSSSSSHPSTATPDLCILGSYTYLYIYALFLDTQTQETHTTLFLSGCGSTCG